MYEAVFSCGHVLDRDILYCAVFIFLSVEDVIDRDKILEIFSCILLSSTVPQQNTALHLIKNSGRPQLLNYLKVLRRSLWSCETDSIP